MAERHPRPSQAASRAVELLSSWSARLRWPRLRWLQGRPRQVPTGRQDFERVQWSGRHRKVEEPSSGNGPDMPWRAAGPRTATARPISSHSITAGAADKALGDAGPVRPAAVPEPSSPLGGALCRPLRNAFAGRRITIDEQNSHILCTQFPKAYDKLGSFCKNDCQRN